MAYAGSSSEDHTGNSTHTNRISSNLPLIKAPGNWLPKMVTLPSDLHPMPDDITAYFVYPYTLEASSLSYITSLGAHPTNWQATLTSSEEYLDQRRLKKEADRLRIEREIEERKKESLRLVAPGWSGEMDQILAAPSPSTAPDATSSSV